MEEEDGRTFDHFTYICKVPASNIGGVDFVKNVVQLDFAARFSWLSRHQPCNPKFVIPLSDCIFVTVFSIHDQRTVTTIHGTKRECKVLTYCIMTYIHARQQKKQNHQCYTPHVTGAAYQHRK